MTDDWKDWDIYNRALADELDAKEQAENLGRHGRHAVPERQDGSDRRGRGGDEADVVRGAASPPIQHIATPGQADAGEMRIAGNDWQRDRTLHQPTHELRTSQTFWAGPSGGLGAVDMQDGWGQFDPKSDAAISPLRTIIEIGFGVGASILVCVWAVYRVVNHIGFW
jgi:hypothetical protein